MERELDTVIFRRNRGNKNSATNNAEKSTQTEERVKVPDNDRPRNPKSVFVSRDEEKSVNRDKHKNVSTRKDEKNYEKGRDKKSSRETSHEDLQRKHVLEREKDSRKERDRNYASSKSNSTSVLKRPRSPSRDKRDDSHKSNEENKRRKYDFSRSNDLKLQNRKEPDLREVILQRNAARKSDGVKKQPSEQKKRRESPRKVKPDTIEAGAGSSETQKQRRESPRKVKQLASVQLTSEVLSIKSSDSDVDVIKEIEVSSDQVKPKSPHVMSPMKLNDAEETPKKAMNSSKDEFQVVNPETVNIASSQDVFSIPSTNKSLPELKPLEEISQPDVLQGNEFTEAVSPPKKQESDLKIIESASEVQLNGESQQIEQKEVNIINEPEAVDDLPLTTNDSFNSSKENSLNQSQETRKHKAKRRSYQKEVCEDGTVVFTVTRSSKSKKKKQNKEVS